MTVNYNGRTYEFRACDTKGITAEQLQKMANESGRMQYEPNRKWLVIPSIGYGWEV